MTDRLNFGSLVKQVIHNIITFMLFYFFFYLVTKSFQLISSDISIFLVIIICIGIILIAKFIVLDFVLGTIIAGFLNSYKYTEQGILSLVTSLTCIFSGVLIAYKKIELFSNYSNKEILYFTFILIFLLTLYLIHQVKIATKNLKIKNASNVAQQLLKSIAEENLTFTDAIKLVSNDPSINNEDKIIINAILRAEFEKLDDGDKEFDEYLSNLLPK